MATTVFAITRRLSRKFSRKGPPKRPPPKTVDPVIEDTTCMEVESCITRQKPNGLDNLVKNTKFSRKELQVMYRGFKQECPMGTVNEETFKHIYAQFFPQGESANYAHYVFNAFDLDGNGHISFEEFVMGLSVLARGSAQEKLQWAFALYDVNRDGAISEDEMTNVVQSIYEMLGNFATPPVNEKDAKMHVDRIFKKMDLDGDGVISLQEFMEVCRTDEAIAHSLTLFDTVL